MGKILSTFPDLPDTTQTVTMDGTQYRGRFVWRERLNAWYADISLLDGTKVAFGRRISPGWGPLFRLLPVGTPSGPLYVRGSDPYRREMLGDEVLVIYYAEDELLPAADTGTLRVTLIP